MKIAVFSSKPHDRELLHDAEHSLAHLEPRLTADTAPLARDYDGICLFVHDTVTAQVAEILRGSSCRLIALRCAGFNNVDLAATRAAGIQVCRVPAYSPYAVAEHAVGLILTLNRKFHRAHRRIRENDFSLNGLMGFDLHGKTVGVVGTGKIGQAFARIMLGFGCQVIAYDPWKVADLTDRGVSYVTLHELFAASDIISLHCPLTPQTEHLVQSESLRTMKRGVMLINTSRGKLIQARDALEALKSGQIGALGLDVYEEEEGVFFENLSDHIINDDTLMRLTTMPNVLITSHQAFFTREAVENIAQVTLENIRTFAATGTAPNLVE